MKVCPKCITEFDDALNFCRHDGTPLNPKVGGKVCPQCGKEVAENKELCRHCGASLEAPKHPEPTNSEETGAHLEEREDQPTTGDESLIEQAENYLREKNYQNAISSLDAVLKANPDDHEARLLHLFASVKLYNIYGYEKQIESIKLLSNLTEKDREIAREIYLIRSGEAQKRGREDEAREYGRLATRVIVGQPLVEPTPEARVEESPAQGVEVTPFPRKAEQRVPMTSGPTPTSLDSARPAVGGNRRSRKRSSRLFISFILVFGLAGLLVLGMLFTYAKKQGVEIKDLFGTKSPTEQQTEEGTETPGPSVVAQVLGVEELGFKVSGAGAADINRQGSLISERINAQLAGLQQLYQEEIQLKPDLMGSVNLQLTIIPSGVVTKVKEFASRIKDKDFKKSIIEEAYKWRFPEAGSGLVKVNYPLLFVPPGMDVATLVRWEQVVGPKGPEPEEPKESATGRQRRKPAKPVTGSGSTPSGMTEVPPPPPLPQPGTQQSGRKVVKVIIGPYEVIYPTSVYSEPREDSQRVAQVQAGTKINVVDVRGDWLEVRSRHNRPPGFIKKDSAVPMGIR